MGRDRTIGGHPRLESVLATGNVDALGAALDAVLALWLLPVAFDLASSAAHTCPRDSALTGGGRLLGGRFSRAIEAGDLDFCDAIGIPGLQGRHRRSLCSERSDLSFRMSLHPSMLRNVDLGRS